MPNKIAQNYFTTGEFAHLVNTTKNTLFHYDELGIFCPAIKAENGYRYYSLAQLDVFGVITMLREIDMPLSEIKNYLNMRSPEQFISLLEQELRGVTLKIAALEQTRALIEAKAKLTRQAIAEIAQPMGLQNFSQADLILTRPLPQNSERNVAVSISEHLRFCNAHDVLSPYAIGAMIHHSVIIKDDFENYSYYYTQVTRTPQQLIPYIRPAGQYLTVYHQGGYSALPETYHKILAFARAQNFCLRGYFYEDVMLDELSMKEAACCVLRISIQASKA